MIKVENLAISFNGREVFDNVNFILNDTDKIGLIGRNGCGKSTLMKILAGELTQDSGSIQKSKNLTIGYLRQYLTFEGANLVDEVCLSFPEHKREYFWEAEQILLKLGFSMEDLEKNPKNFSGGYQIRLNLAKLLAEDPDILMLDEPTNYLDIYSIRWLKGFLQSWEKGFILITHDRGFMDEVINNVVIVHRGESQKMIGNTQDMYDRISADEENYEKTRLNENKKRDQLEKFINRFRSKASMATRVQSKIKLLDKKGQKDQLDSIDNLDFKFNYKETTTNADLMEIEDLTFGYTEDNLLIKNFNFNLKKDDKVCIIGKNGKGKSTLLNLIAGELTPISGKISQNPKVETGFFGQTNIERMNLEHSIKEELKSTDESLLLQDIMRVAGVIMFPDDLANKKIKVLSGGERSRVLLGKVILKENNLLLLDEPTNHLDMESNLSLLSSIKFFKGAVFIVTHNEELIHEVANKLIVFDEGNITFFDGDYQEFLDKVGWSEEESAEPKKVKKANSSNNVNRKENKKSKKNNSGSEKSKLENLLLEKETELEKSLLAGKYSNIDLEKEIKELTKQLEDLS